MAKQEKALKRLHGYERNVPRCGNCTHIQVYENVNGGNVIKCKQLKFEVARNARCDLWKSKKGEVLDNG